PDDAQPTERFVFGPLGDVDTGVMRASSAAFFTTSELCASCHQYLAPFGQTTYTEWLASPFAQPGLGFRSCQDCHMPEREGIGQICDIGNPADRPGSQRHRHDFVGSTPQTLADNLGLELEVFQDPDGVRVLASVENFGAGHDFPTGVSIRNAMVLIQAEVGGQSLDQIGGDTIPSWASDDVPGVQPGDYGGLPGKGFAKVLEGRINGMGEPVSPVLFVDAETVLEKSNIPSGATDVTEVLFALPADAEVGETLQVEARLLYRRAFRALAVTKGWTVTPLGGPIEIEVASRMLEQTLTVSPVEIPVLGPAGSAILAALLLLIALAAIHRR
ncbi:MAG: NapC/NirT family cytochrome c, partial [Holophagales bacterium]|nr:NapC/NirT family cytochrome c [Holophagales bacterium]